jgi:hypothetical protein
MTSRETSTNFDHSKNVRRTPYSTKPAYSPSEPFSIISSTILTVVLWPIMFIYWLRPYLGLTLSSIISLGLLVFVLINGFQGNWDSYQFITGAALPFGIVFWFIRMFNL